MDREGWVRLRPEGGSSVGLQNGGVSDEFLLSRRWLALGTVFRQPRAEAPRPETPCQSGAPSCRATRLDRADVFAMTEFSLESTIGPAVTATPRARGYEACFMLSIPRRMKTRMRI